MKKRKKGILLIAIALVILIIFLIAFFATRKESTQEKVALAKCLTAQGFSMAGTEWCPHCKAQKDLFGPAFLYIDYHDCDKETDWCQGHGVEGYPTWIGPRNTTSAGTKELSVLKKMSGCR